MTCDSNTDPGMDRLNALFGVYAFYLRLEERVDQVNLSPALSRTERHLLITLSQPKRMGDLARELHTLPSTVTAAADQLEGAGLALRARDPSDRRAWLLQLTESGQQARRDLISRAARLFEEASGLAKEEMDQLVHLLGKVREYIHETGLPEGYKK